MLRLWVSSADYTQDMRMSKDILKQLSRGLSEDPQHLPAICWATWTASTPTDQVAFAEHDGAGPVGPQPLQRAGGRRAAAAYDRYEFHGVYRAIYNFCVVDMSNFYLDIIKDRLYCEGADALSPPQRPDRHLLSCWTRMVRLHRPHPGLHRRGDLGTPCPTPRATTPRACCFNDMPEVTSPPTPAARTQQAYWEKLIWLCEPTSTRRWRNARAAKRGQEVHRTPRLTLYFNDEAWAPL